MRALTLIATALSLTLTVPACFAPDTPCEEDAFGCADGDGFITGLTCQGTDPLLVQVGHGERRFTPMSDEEWPTIHRGMQGGEHTFMAFRIRGAELSTYDRLRARVTLNAVVSPYSGCQTEVVDPAGQVVGCEMVVGDREVVLGTEETPFKVEADGTIEITGLLVFLDWYGGSEALRVSLEVEDPCGRLGVQDQTLTRTL